MDGRDDDPNRNAKRAERPARKRVAWHSPVALARGLASRPKLYLAIAGALATLFLAPTQLPPSARAVLAWDIGALVYVAFAWRLFAVCGTEHIRRTAASEDETRFVFFGLILLAVVASFGADIGLIGEARAAKDGQMPLYVGLAAVAILCSWLVVQIVFTLHYAHDYYRDVDRGDREDGGLRFPEENEPDYWDFFYFTTSIGATSQTSDVSVTSRPMRRLVTVQAVLSFVFNTTIVALAINLAASLL